MNTTSLDHGHPQAVLRAEHDALYREIAAWRDWWSELCEFGEPHFGEMGDRLARFREHLRSHFEHEMREGLLGESTELPPEAAAQARELRSHHAELLAALDALVSRLQACEPEFAGWSDAKDEFEAFLDRLDAHEREEDALVERLTGS